MDYKQDLESELAGMIAGIAFVIIIGTGFAWALIFGLRWFLV